MAYQVESLDASKLRETLVSQGAEQSRERGWASKVQGDQFAGLAGHLSSASRLHLDPKALRASSPLFSSGTELWFTSENGHGLASVYQGINSRDVDAFVALRDELRKLFPAVKNLKVLADAEKNVAFQVALHDGKLISAEAMSEGMLYFLAFSALRHLNPRGALLIEEPENGLHPARIAEVVSLLRAVSKTTQVIVATHSPLVINALDGHEVSVITRSLQGGTRATLLKDTFNYQERSRFFSNGELWLMHSDGREEHDLLLEPAPASFPGGASSVDSPDRERSAS